MINESLKTNDLRHFVSRIVTIDSFKSKIGDDQDVVTLCFEVDDQDPAKDLEHFIEMGYDFVLDADVSPGETDDGTYKVFVELERNKHVGRQIIEMLKGIELLTGIPDMRFRYFKGFKSQEATIENLETTIPMDKNSYEIATDSNMLENFSNFFANSYVDRIEVIEETISFKRTYGDKLSFNIVTSGSTQEVHNTIKGPVMLENKDMAEVMFLTKCIGNYNITKVGSKLIFENRGYSVVLEK
jgi:hypothetical protein